MKKLRMTFDTQKDFYQACEYFENHSKYKPCDICNEDMQIFFETKSGTGADARKRDIEEDIMYCNFEYDTFIIL